MTGPGPADVVERLLADPPHVHAMDHTENAELGVWSTERGCYEFIRDWVVRHQGDAAVRTLETGSGISTALFAHLGTQHTCVTPSQDEADRITAYCASHDIPAGGLHFIVGSSDDVLPGLGGELDLVLIDGCHGFPLPMIDWYYAGQRVRQGGIVIFDDTPIPAVVILVTLLSRDPRWQLVTDGGKWSAWKRLDEGALRQDWFEQPWFWLPIPGIRELVGRAVSKVRGRSDRGPRLPDVPD